MLLWTATSTRPCYTSLAPTRSSYLASEPGGRWTSAPPTRSLPSPSPTEEIVTTSVVSKHVTTDYFKFSSVITTNSVDCTDDCGKSARHYTSEIGCHKQRRLR